MVVWIDAPIAGAFLFVILLSGISSRSVQEMDDEY